MLEQAIPKEYVFKEFVLSRKDGNKAYGISISHPKNQATIMYFGGNRFDIGSKGPGVIKNLIEADVNVVMFDHRGYGKSTGKPTVELLFRDALENYEYARSVFSGPLILHGHSLGSFEAGHVAENRAVDGLVLESSVTDAREWSRMVTPWYIKPFVKIKIDKNIKVVNNLQVVKKQLSPLFIMVGAKDKLTLPKLSQKLYQEAIAKQKFLHVFPDAGHTNVKSQPQFKNVYRQFIKSVISGNHMFSQN